MQRLASVCLAAAAGLVLAGRAGAGDRRVPSRYKTIQAAIDAARPFDRVLVAPGVYHERITFKGVPLVVESEQGARLTTLDGGGRGPVVTFHPRDDRFVVLRGFTVTGGRVDADQARGAGIYCPGGSPVLVENVITANRTTGRTVSHGAGLYVTGEPLVVNNEISDNIAVATEKNTDHAGGGLYAAGGWFFLNRITGNSLVSNRYIGDKVYRSRGGGAVLAGQAVFVENRVVGNHACFFGEAARGGGLLVQGQPVIALNLIRANTARGVHGRGGGIYCEANARPTIYGNVIVENFAESETRYEALGGGIYLESRAAPVIAYNTVHANRTSGVRGRGGGLFASGASPRVVGCIFWDNTFWWKNKDQKVISFEGLTASMVHDSVVGDGQFTGVNGNFRADPRLEDAYHLAADSPCIDRGEATNPTVAVAVDIDGGTRVLDGRGTGRARIDVGAHEFGVLRRAGRRAVRPGDGVPLLLEARGLPSRPYLCAASLGQAGIPLPPPDPRVIPLALDPLFALSIGQRRPPFTGFTGFLDRAGVGRLRLDVGSHPSVAGLTLYVAGVVVEGASVRLVTNNVPIRVER